MIADPHDRHDRQHRRQRADMDRDDEHQRRYHHRPGQRFPGVKAHRRPGRRRAAGMMHRMGDAKGLGPVHPAMRPVKPCVMRGQVKQHRHGKVPDREGCDIGIDARPSTRLPSPCDDPGGDAVNQRGQQRPADLPTHLPLQPAIQARLPHPRRQRKTTARQQIANADNGAHRQSGPENSCDHPAPIQTS